MKEPLLALRKRPLFPRGHFRHDESHADYSPEELEFLRAIDQFKRGHRRPFPTWREVLQVLKSLGYRKENSA